MKLFEIKVKNNHMGIVSIGNIDKITIETHKIKDLIDNFYFGIADFIEFEEVDILISTESEEYINEQKDSYLQMSQQSDSKIEITYIDTTLMLNKNQFVASFFGTLLDFYKHDNEIYCGRIRHYVDKLTIPLS